ncbi:extracellular solute-binding protein [Segnochrobactraceae bacterium EtOH-i3]
MKSAASLLAAALLAASALTAPAFAQSKGELNIYNWTDYTSEELTKKFEEETGIKVNVDTYDSNETLLAKLKSGATGYDIVVVSSDFVPIFAKEGLIEEIDASKLSNFGNLDPKWKGPAWDPENKYTLPFVWGITSYTIDTDVYKGPTDSLKTLFEPPAELKGKVGMFGSPTEVMSLALVYLGKPQCNTNPADLKEMQVLLEKQKPSVKIYNSDGIRDRQVSGETVAHQVWSGDGLRSRLEKPSIKFVFAKEGGVAWMDNMAVPKNAPNAENAKKFLEFYMKPENAALQSNFSGYPNAVAGSEKFVDKTLAEAPEFSTPEGYKYVFAPTCSPEAIRFYDRIWTKLRT